MRAAADITSGLIAISGRLPAPVFGNQRCASVLRPEPRQRYGEVSLPITRLSLFSGDEQRPESFYDFMMGELKMTLDF